MAEVNGWFPGRSVGASCVVRQRRIRRVAPDARVD